MTVALNDVVMLSQMLGEVRYIGDWDEVSGVLHAWHWGRKPLSSTINILSVALYDLFGAEGEFYFCAEQRRMLTDICLDANLAVLRRGCFKYFELGGGLYQRARLPSRRVRIVPSPSSLCLL